jgi:hypothetical protein
MRRLLDIINEPDNTIIDMSRPKITSKANSVAMMPGSFRLVAVMECGWCWKDFQVEADNEEEAHKAFIEEGVRYVYTDDLEGLFCPECVDAARKNQLEP